MLDELSPEQFDEWIAYSLVEPFGATAAAERDAYAIEILAATAGAEFPTLETLRRWGYEDRAPQPISTTAAVEATGAGFGAI